MTKQTAAVVVPQIDKLIPGLEARLARAMRKEGKNTVVKLVNRTVPMAYDDLTGIQVMCDDVMIALRAQVWIFNALKAAGIKHVRTGGSWGRGPTVVGDVMHFSKQVGAEYVIMVVTQTASIGELASSTKFSSSVQSASATG